MATCSSDKLVKIFEIKANGQSFPVAELNGHEGPVWQVSWAHPDYENTIATCSHDRLVTDILPVSNIRKYFLGKLLFGEK